MDNTGKIPPQDTNIEEVILASFLVDAGSYEFIDTLHKNIFYKPAHGIIFEAIQELSNENKGIDLLTVTDRLRTKQLIEEVGGVFYITELTSKISISANIKEYCQIIIEKYIQREVIHRAGELSRMAFNDDQFDEMLDYMAKFDGEISDMFSDDIEMERLDKLADEGLEDAIQRNENFKNGIQNGIPIPIYGIQQMLGGWQNTDLIIIAARPSMGKTAFALHCAKYAAKKDSNVLYFSLEMGRRQLNTRLVLSETTIDPEKWRNGDISTDDFDEYKVAASRTKHYKLFINDKPALSPKKIGNIVKKLKPDLVVIDYLQLMTANVSNYQNRNLEIGSITKALKGIAKDYDVPVIVLSQLSRSVEGRANKSPLLYDLRDSGEIENDADVVLFLFRPSVYEDTPDNKEKVQFIVAKQRNGRTGFIHSYHNKYISDFADEPINKPF